MRRTICGLVLVALAGVSVLLVEPVASSRADAESSFIVVLRPSGNDIDTVAASLSESVTAELSGVYDAALDGFSMTATDQEAATLARSPLVAYVERDLKVTVDVQDTPTGMSRSFAAGNRSIDIDGVDDVRVDADVAVLDGGIDLQHPDLVVAGGVDCTNGVTCVAGGDDDAQHGTHVAGIIGALDNDVGVVGVAPGARLWAVKVLDSTGNGFISGILRGLDWVTANAATIEVVNMSLGAAGYSQALYDAIQTAVNGGVAFAVSAGNFDVDAGGYSPASFNNVMTVSALADFDGRPGALGSPTCRFDQDDSLADFSNWGSVIDIAAPGSCIRSTVPIERGSYGLLSGTSMAAPHVAGALALLARVNNPSTATGVQALYGTLLSAGNDQWSDDSGDGVREPLLDLSAPSLFAAVAVPCAALDGTGLLGWWPANDTLAATNGQSLVGSTSFTAAVVGRGFQTSTTSSLSSTTLGIVGSTASVEAWVKPAPSAGTTQVLMGRWNFPSTDDSARSYSLSLTPLGDLVFETDELTRQRPDELRASAAALLDGNFHHIAATWGPAVIKLYIDGSLVASKASQGGSLNAAGGVPFRIGSKSGLGDPFRYQGIIDEPSVWERELSATEIADLAAAGPAGKCLFVP